MIETRLIEIRDAGTFIPALAVKLDDADPKCRYLLRRAGWSAEDIAAYVEGARNPVYLLPLTDHHRCTYDPYKWGGSRTYMVAHFYLRGEQVGDMQRTGNWDEIDNGHVVCVEWILGLRDTPKRSESETVPQRGGR